MAQHVKHMTDNCRATEGGRAFSWRIGTWIQPRSAVMHPYSMAMVATKSTANARTTSLAMRYHTMAPTVSPPAIQSFVRCSKSRIVREGKHLYHNSDRRHGRFRAWTILDSTILDDFDTNRCARVTSCASTRCSYPCDTSSEGWCTVSVGCLTTNQRS